MKTCTKCGESKPLSDFYWSKSRQRYESSCKRCTSVRTLRYRAKHLDRIKEAQKVWQTNNRDRTRMAQDRYHQRNPNAAREARSRYAEAHRPEMARKMARWRDRNREHSREYMRSYYQRGYYARRRAKPEFRITSSLRSRLRAVLSGAGTKKTERMESILGASVVDVRAHLEAQFLPGMTWENYGLHGWHIDHIRPCASFDLTDPEQQRQCFHWTNLQPLWAAENIRKGARVS